MAVYMLEWLPWGKILHIEHFFSEYSELFKIIIIIIILNHWGISKHVTPIWPDAYSAVKGIFTFGSGCKLRPTVSMEFAGELLPHPREMGVARGPGSSSV